MPSYYNEHDREKAAWLRELIRRGLIAPGDVDERDVRDVVPTELAGYRQCHFFAGVGVWSYALRLAGWPDDRHVWTVSCPCQSFSAAGKRKGFADERHLWPSWFHIAGQCRPRTVFGEQVESPDGLAWLDLIWTDMEALGYAFGTVVFPAAGCGAPHERHRIWFVADMQDQRQPQRPPLNRGRASRVREEGERGGLADDRGAGVVAEDGRGVCESPGDCASCLMVDAGRPGLERLARDGDGNGRRSATVGPVAPPGPTNGFWSDAEWLPCTDGKARPVRPGSFPLVDGAPARVVRLRGYGDGIVATAAEAFIRAYMESR